jgi:CHASE1-domain containing sensor protein
MSINVKQAALATIFYLFLCTLTYLTAQSLTFIHFIGVMAGATSAFTVVWGTGALVGILLATIAYCIGIQLFFNYSTPYPVLLIGMLAIWLQAIWTKRLTYKLVAQQQWLKSRETLFSFMLRIGPVPSIISASTTLFLVTLSSQSLTVQSSYIFFSSWAGSLLVGVLLTPIFLFSKKMKNVILYKRLLIIISSILLCLAIALLSYYSNGTEQEARYKRFHDMDAKIHQAINEEVEQISEQIWALGALFIASENVSSDQFENFSSHIYRDDTNIRALEWVPIVHGNKREDFEKDLSVITGKITPIWHEDYQNNYQVVKTKGEYRPVSYIYPQEGNKSAFGLDLLSNADKKIAMVLAQRLKKIVSTVPLDIVQDDRVHSTLLLFFPIHNKQRTALYSSHYMNETFDNSLNGYVVAVVQLAPLFENIMKNIDNEYINVFIQDISNNERYFLYGNESHASDNLSSIKNLRIFSRKWQITVTEDSLWLLQSKDWVNWLILLGITSFGLLLQFFIMSVAAYLIELNNQLKIKEEALESADEVSEQKNLAKNYFLKTLGGELRTPIYAIKYFMTKFNQEPTFDQAKSSMSDILITSENLIKLVDTVVDITDIEFGGGTTDFNDFQLPDFLYRIETILNAKNTKEQRRVKFHLSSDLVPFIRSDEVRLQKFIIALAESATQLLSNNKINISVKSHQSKNDIATIFILITPHAYDYFESGESSVYEYLVGKDLSGYSTAMAMVKEVCHLFEGDVKLNKATNGGLLLSSSIKVKIKK